MAFTTVLWQCHPPPSPSSSPSSFRTLKPTLSLPRRHLHRHHQLCLSSRSSATTPPRAYVTGPASDPIISDPDPKLDESPPEKPKPPNVITWELLSTLLMKHKLRLAVTAASLFACSACTLSMPIFSGNTSISP